MKKKLKRTWCRAPSVRLAEDYKFDAFRCPECGRRLKVVPVYDEWDSVLVKGRRVPEIVFKTVRPHKTKVEYKTSS